MLRCLLKEWRHAQAKYDLTSVRTIFFGGGTPSLMPLRLIETLVREIAGGAEVEVSLEGNPGDMLGRVPGLQTAGVTRVSVGVQALSDHDLKLLNRDHDVRQALKAVEESLAVFPKSTSADLIFGRPRHSLEVWLSELRTLVDLGLTHLSMYQLTVERGTELWRQVQRGDVEVPDHETMAELYLRGVELLEQLGLPRYEVSNFGQTECLHNTGYWSGRPYLGLGPGAHSRIGLGHLRTARVNIPSPALWLSSVENKGHGEILARKVDVKESVAELIATGLRRKNGISSKAWREASGDSLNVDEFIEAGERYGIVTANDSIMLSAENVSILDSILPYLINVIDDMKTQC